MNPGGWIFMGLSWVIIIGLATFCFRRILTKGLGEGRADKKKGP